MDRKLKRALTAALILACAIGLQAQGQILAPILFGTGSSGGVVQVTDNFTRADASPLSGNWHTDSVFDNLQIVSNTSQPTTLSVIGSEYNTGATWPNDQQSVTTITLNTGTQYAGPAVRSNGAGTSYRVIAGSDGDPTIYIQKCTGTTTCATQGAGVSYTHANGDKIGLSASGSSTTTLTLYINGVLQTTRSDSSTPILSGSPGIAQYAETAVSRSQVTLFCAGSLAANCSGGGGGPAIDGAGCDFPITGSQTTPTATCTVPSDATGAVVNYGGGNGTTVTAAAGTIGTFTLCKASNSSAERAEIWTLLNPATGSKTVALTLSGSVTAAFHVDFYKNVTSFGSCPNGTNGSTSPASITVTGATGNLFTDLIVEDLGTCPNGNTPGMGQTQVGNICTNGQYLLATSWKAGASSTALTWTFTNQPWVQLGVPIQ